MSRHGGRQGMSRQGTAARHGGQAERQPACQSAHTAAAATEDKAVMAGERRRTALSGTLACFCAVVQLRECAALLCSVSVGVSIPMSLSRLFVPMLSTTAAGLFQHIRATARRGLSASQSPRPSRRQACSCPPRPACWAEGVGGDNVTGVECLKERGQRAAACWSHSAGRGPRATPGPAHGRRRYRARAPRRQSCRRARSAAAGARRGAGPAAAAAGRSAAPTHPAPARHGAKTRPTFSEEGSRCTVRGTPSFWSQRTALPVSA